MSSKFNIYYKEWIVGNKVYKLEFIASSNIPLGATPTETELPDEFIVNTCKVRNEYEDGYPIGMPLTEVMELELDLTGLNKTMPDLVTWILAEPEKMNNIYEWHILVEGITLPNQWRLSAKNIGESSYTDIRFWGVQDIKPEIEFTGKAQARVKITAVSILRAALERLPVEKALVNLSDDLTYNTLKADNKVKAIFNVLNSAVWNYNRLIDYHYDNEAENKTTTIYTRPMTGEIVILLDIDYFIDYIQTVLVYYLSVLARYDYENGTSLNVSLPYLFRAFDLNFLDHTDIKQGEGGMIDFGTDKIYMIAGVKVTDTDYTYLYNGQRLYNTTFVGGLFAPGKENSLYEYPSTWDLLKALYESDGTKITITYSLTSITLLAKKIFENISTNAVTVNDFGKDYTLKKNAKLINSVIVNLKGGSDSDINDITRQSVWTQAEASYEIESVLHNTPYNLNHDKDNYGDDPKSGSVFGELWRAVFGGDGNPTLLKQRVERNNIPWRTLYCEQTIHEEGKDVLGLVKPSGTVQYYYSPTDSGTTLTPQDLPEATAVKIFKTKMQFQLNERQYFEGTPYALADGLLKAFGNANQGEFKSVVNSELINNTDLGEMYSFDANAIHSIPLGFRDPSGYYNSLNAIVTIIETDYTKNISEVELFIRGD